MATLITTTDITPRPSQSGWRRLSGLALALTLALAAGFGSIPSRIYAQQPGASYGVQLHAGSPGLPSAGFTQVASVIADASGRVKASGLVRFRGTDDIALMDIADGNHVITVVGSGQTVAVGSIPALQPLG